MCIWYTVIHESSITIKSVVSGRFDHLLAALADVFVVGRGDLLGLVARQLDAAAHVRRDHRLVPALPQERVYSLDLVPTWKYPIYTFEN